MSLSFLILHLVMTLAARQYSVKDSLNCAASLLGVILSIFQEQIDRSCSWASSQIICSEDAHPLVFILKC